jgi:hypothetical protein
MAIVKTIKCKYCKGTHTPVARSSYYYCPNVFGGWVRWKRAAPRPKILYYRKALIKCLRTGAEEEQKWEWSCPVWFNEGIFADCTIKSAHYLTSEEAAVKDLTETMKKFGVTKRTKLA